jgi:hypothetical protein
VGLFLLAWLGGQSIIIWRWAKNGAPPTPGALAAPSVVYLALAVMAEYQPARATAIALAWGLDLAILLQVVGKAPAQSTGWPPLCIPAGQLMPRQGSGVPCASLSSAGGTPSNSGVVGLGNPGPVTTLPPAVPGAPSISPGQGGGTDETGIFPVIT